MRFLRLTRGIIIIYLVRIIHPSLHWGTGSSRGGGRGRGLLLLLLVLLLLLLLRGVDLVDVLVPRGGRGHRRGRRGR